MATASRWLGSGGRAVGRALSGPILGIGAFGFVQLVHYTKTGKTYAIKTLTKKSILKTDQLGHVRDEIVNLRASTNQFIVRRATEARAASRHAPPESAALRTET